MHSERLVGTSADDVRTFHQATDVPARGTADSGAEELRQMKPAGVPMDTDRRALIIEQALMSALLDGRLAGTEIDVFAEELLAEGSPVRIIRRVWMGSNSTYVYEKAVGVSQPRCIEGVLKVVRATDS